ncbi:zinc transporter 2 isoform X1 [Daphnia magna]|uniref:zinc transporter 2 isoform X1 n=1 Tax=Daphnia magna TaxID=35525 RepID=UPI001E1BDCC4|nr:zinc transporter 2 isoform X1 [Daphnia magna]
MAYVELQSLKLKGSRVKNTTTAPDLLTDSYPLDNSSVTEVLEYQQSRTDSSLFNQLAGRIPTNEVNSSSRSPWNEVNGDWRHLRNPLATNDLVINREELLCFDSDQIDVPLLTSSVGVDAQFSRESETWDHCHQRELNSNKQVKARNQLIAASLLCLVFMIAEAVGGYLSNSLAVMTDAAHMLSDFTSFLVSLFAIWVSARPPSKKMSFGYYRAEILGALFSVLVIWILTGVLIYLAIDRIIHQDYDIDANTMIIVSTIGVVMNIAMGAILHGGLCNKLSLVHHGHSHGIGGGGHGHSHANGGHGHTHNHHGHTSNGSRNMNVRAALIHVVGDLVQSIGVLIAAIVIKYWPNFRLADPICTFLFSGLVLTTTIGLIRDASHVLMEGVPRNIQYHELRRDLKSINGVCNVHSLHVWSLTLDRNALAVHLAIGVMTDAEEVLSNATRLVQIKYGIAHCTVQVERFNAAAIEVCPQCTTFDD